VRNECGAITWLPTSAWEPQYVLKPPQSLFVFRCYLYDVFHHYFWERSNNNHTARETNRTGWRRSALHCWFILVKALSVLLHCGCICEVHCGCIFRNALWVFETETTTTATHAVVSERLEPRYGSVAKYKCLYAATPVSYVSGKQNVIHSNIVHSWDFMSVFICMSSAINSPLKTVSQQEHEQNCLSTFREKFPQNNTRLIYLFTFR